MATMATLYIDLCIDKKDKCKAFLYVIGPAGRDIFTAFVLKDDEKDKIDVLFKKFEDYCNTLPRSKRVCMWINM